MRAAPASEPAAPAVIAVGLLGVLRRLACRSRRVLIAMDDLCPTWNSTPAARVGAVVARAGCDGTRVAFLLARRPRRSGSLEAVLADRGRASTGRVVSLGAVRRLLFERLGLGDLAPAAAADIEATGGNPLSRSRSGVRCFRRRGIVARARMFPCRIRLRKCSATGGGQGFRRVSAEYLARHLRLSEDPRVDHLIGIAGSDALDDAVDAGTIQIDGGRVRASHPLLAAVAGERSRARRERREVHLALSVAAGDEPVRAMHLALAATGPDEGVASPWRRRPSWLACVARVGRRRCSRRKACV